MEPMAQAAINARTPQPIIETFDRKEESVNRYVWYPGEDLPWPEIKGGFIRRCRVTPIVPFLIWERINDVPDDLRKSYRRDLLDKDWVEVQYEIKPQGIFESVEAQYGEMGMMELKALQGMQPEEVAALELDAIFAPWKDIPKPYREIAEHIRLTLSADYLTPLQRAVGEEMLASIKKSREYDELLVDRTESAKEPIYSKPVFRAMSRLERRRRDHALTDMAAADLDAKKAAAQASNDNSALVAEMAEQNRLKREELELRREELELNRQMMAKGRPPRLRRPARKAVNAE